MANIVEWEAKFLKVTGKSVSVSWHLRQMESMPVETKLPDEPVTLHHCSWESLICMR
ncbi:hypothetical protein T4E_6238 [Trichinella pseudospiralis]|uniref:Uncharacterized protein n=1 Tax=Trichinella pseudospiralis TaxID=6337 RepID=A0A0V0XER5_TRIPS|nr:hypothetical protein T4E_6238 [Trichinella pseudospiralis]